MIQIASVHFDERPHEWRSVYDTRGYAQLVDDILIPPPAGSPEWVHGHRMIILGDHPYEPGGRQRAKPMLLVAVGTSSAGLVGAAYYRQVDDDGIVGWVTNNPDPIPDPPEFAFTSQAWNNFPPTAVIDEQELRELVMDFLGSGRRPESIAWKESEFVQ